MRVVFTFVLFAVAAVLAGLGAFLLASGRSGAVEAGSVCVAAALVLLWLAVWARRRARGAASRSPRPPSKRRSAERHVVVDGSNVMYWKGGEPRIEPVVETVRTLKTRGYEVGVMFDANAGYLLADRYLHHGDFAKWIGVSESHIMVAPKGTPADQHILTAARDLDARVVSNDRFRDWEDAFPEVRQPGRLVQGAYADGRLSLDLGDGESEAE